jgi:hypothetical protein
MIETAIIITIGVTTLLLMSGTIIALGFNLNSSLKDEDKIDKKEYQEQLKRNYNLVYGASGLGVYARPVFHSP